MPKKGRFHTSAGNEKGKLRESCSWLLRGLGSPEEEGEAASILQGELFGGLLVS